MLKKIIASILSVIIVGTVALSFVGCKNKKEVRVKTVNGEIVSSEKIKGSDNYKNVIKLEDGELWESTAVYPLKQTEKEQFISKGDPDELPNMILIRIAPNDEK